MALNIIASAVSAEYVLELCGISNAKLSELVISGKLPAYRVVTVNIDTNEGQAIEQGFDNNIFREINSKNEKQVCYKIDVNNWGVSESNTISNWTSVFFDKLEVDALTSRQSHAFVEVGKLFNVSRERIRMIPSKALRKLRHPIRSSKLREYFESDETDAKIKNLEIKITRLENVILNLEVKDRGSLLLDDLKQNEIPEKPKKEYKFGAITKNAAARLCGVSERTFHSWETGERKPKIPGFPGRSNLASLMSWSFSLKEFQKMVKPARAMSRATPMSPGDIEKRSNQSAWDDDA